MEILHVPQGEFRLNRYPKRKKELLRAWDAADEYLLNYVHSEFNLEAKKLLIINDSFGALSSSLASHSISAWTDSWLSEQGILQNYEENALSNGNLEIINSVDSPSSQYDVVLINIETFEDLASVLEDDFYELLEDFISDTPTQLELLHTAIEDSNFTKIFEISHAQSGASGNLGLERFHTLCELASAEAKNENIESCRELSQLLQENYNESKKLLTEKLNTRK